MTPDSRLTVCLSHHLARTEEKPDDLIVIIELNDGEAADFLGIDD